MASISKKRRLDRILVDQGLVESRERGQALIMEGRVYVDGQKITKAGTPFALEVVISLESRPSYVGRGGLKLAHALERFHVNPSGLTVLDIGASTGGFTDCLLQAGSKKVYALDVGHGQIDYQLRKDPRVSVMEGVNAHYPFQLPEKVDIVTVDVSFISLSKVIPNLVDHLSGQRIILALVKPQFEAHPSDVGKGGIIKDPKVHSKILGTTILWAIRSRLRIRGLEPSPILGTRGNREFFMFLTPSRANP